MKQEAASGFSSVPGKIIIRGTSKLSLKDRFARLSNEIEHQQTVQANESNVTAANRRLAMELGNSPDVAAAFNKKKKPVFQRLGVKSRLGGFHQFGYQQRNGFSPYNMRGYRNYNGGQFGYYNNGYYRAQNFGPKRMDNNRMNSFSGFRFGRGGFRNHFRGNGGGWRFPRGGRGRRGNGGNGGQKEQMSREELDRQLDEYMSKTKTALDDDLDAYMGEATIM